MAAEKMPVLAYTDLGRDVDDIEALAYLNGAPNTEIVGVVTSHMIPYQRALIARRVLNHLGQPDVPVGVGSIFPVGQEHEQLVAYLKTHEIDGKSYEGEGMIPTFPSGRSVALNAIAKHGQDLRIAVFAPMTDLAHLAGEDPDVIGQVGGIFIQGQATVDDGRLAPDPTAYNLKEDMAAAEQVFALQDRVPFTLVGKHAAYQVPLVRHDFDTFAGTHHPVGKYLKHHAQRGLESFAQREPAVFERVFGLPADQVHLLDELSKPYDALAAKAIANPHGLRAERLGHHALIGMSQDSPGIELADVSAVRHDITSTIMLALRRRRMVHLLRHTLRLEKPIAA